MTLHENIKSQMIEAMRAKDTVRLGVIRSLLAMFQSEQIAKSSNESFLSDTDAVTLIKRAVKQRKDSIEQFIKGGRPELAETEQTELTVLEAFLPAMMSKADIKKVAEAKKAELAVTDKSKMGLLIGSVMKELNGKADGADVKEVVESLFN